MALRVKDWKIVFSEQCAEGLEAWREPFSSMRLPKWFNLRSDPFEVGKISFRYNDWMLEQNCLMYASQPIVGQWLSSFKAFPPRAKAASFSIDRVVESLTGQELMQRVQAGARAFPDAEPDAQDERGVVP